MKRVLVINPFGIGDVIFTLPLIERLREARQGLFIGFLGNERTRPLLRMDASIDRVFVFNRGLLRRLWRKSPALTFKKYRELFLEIRRERFDTLFDLSLGREYSFFAMLAGIRRRIGLDYKGRGIFLTDKKRIDGYSSKPVTDIQLELLRDWVGPAGAPGSLPLNLSAEAIEWAGKFLRAGGVHESGGKVLAVAPGGGKSWGPNAIFKQWNPERFAQAASRQLENLSYQAILVMGDRSERFLLETVAGLVGPKARVVAGESLERVSALLSRSNALLCNDGGLLHLANALGVRTVSIFGPVDEKVYGPYGESVDHAILTQDVACRPCYQNFRFPPCPHHRRCLDEIKVEKVVAALEKMA
jgi:heptosyltransferase-2